MVEPSEDANYFRNLENLEKKIVGVSAELESSYWDILSSTGFLQRRFQVQVIPFRFKNLKIRVIRTRRVHFQKGIYKNSPITDIIVVF